MFVGENSFAQNIKFVEVKSRGIKMGSKNTPSKIWCIARVCLLKKARQLRGPDK